MHIDEATEYNRLYRGKPVEVVVRDAAAIGSLREITIPQSEHIEKLEERVERLEAALRDVVRCMIDGKVDMAAVMQGELHDHCILGAESAQAMVEVYHRLKAQMGDPGYDTP